MTWHNTDVIAAVTATYGFTLTLAGVQSVVAIAASAASLAYFLIRIASEPVVKQFFNRLRGRQDSR